MRKKNCSLALAILAGALLASSPIMADTFSVYVGYADNLRASGFFPTPWIGAAGVVSNQSGAQSFDAGAVRIDNTGATDITITGFTISLDNGSFVFPTAQFGDLFIAAGKTGIFTQSFSYNLDTSDFGFLPVIGIDATHPLGGCTNPGALSLAQQTACITNQPVVSFSENGNAFSGKDTGHILDTFGYDFINGSSDGNESINWNLLGSGANRGGTGGVPEPASGFLVGSVLLAVVAPLRKRLLKK